MAQNENITLSLGDKIDILNKTQSLDARYGVYDSEIDALTAMQNYGLDGRQVAVYTDKPNGKARLYLYNGVLHQLEPISGVEVEWGDIGGDQSDVNISGFTNDSGFTTNDGTVTSVSGGTGLTGNVTSSGSISLNSASIASLAKADTALQNITGLISQGTNITITGTGTALNPYEISAIAGGTGTVTSVGLSVPTGLQVSGSPIVSSGTFGVTYASGYQGYTTAEASKLSGIETGAQVNVNADWNSNSGDSQILNKPTIPAKTSDLTNDSGFITINEIPVLTNDDNTLIIDDDIIRLNVTNVTEEFTANGTDRNFEMTNVYTSIENVFINGVRIKKSDYITISEQEIEIKTTATLLSGDEVVIQGTMFIEQ